MRIAIVHGNVTLSRCHPSFAGATLRLATPLTSEELTLNAQPVGDTIVVWDDLGAGANSLIAVSEGSEASQPFRPEIKPVDSYNAALIDQLDVDTTKC